MDWDGLDGLATFRQERLGGGLMPLGAMIARRDRRLDRIDDIFTVDLVASYIKWKLGVSAAAETNGHAPAPHPSRQESNLCAI
jgi:hypothetical protein